MATIIFFALLALMTWVTLYFGLAWGFGGAVALSLICYGLVQYSEKRGRSPDEAMGAVMFYGILLVAVWSGFVIAGIVEFFKWLF